MNQSKNMQRNQQFGGVKEMRKILEKKLRHTISDSIRGLFDQENQQHDLRTGRPWIQKQAIRIDGINGIALVDAYEQFDRKFVQLKQETVLGMVRHKSGLFVTADPLHDDEFCPEFVTHHVTDFITLDRLRFQIAEMFDLSFFMSWDNENFHSYVRPYCHVESLRKEAESLGKGYLHYRIGTEKDVRRILRSGLKMNHQTTKTSHRLSESERDTCAAKAMEAISEFVRDIFDSGDRWGVASPIQVEETPETLEAPPSLISLEEQMMAKATVSEIVETMDDEPEMELDTVDTMLAELSNDPDMMPAAVEAEEKNAVLV